MTQQRAKLSRLLKRLIVRERDAREYGNLIDDVALIRVAERPSYVRVVMEGGTITQALNRGPGRVQERAGLAVKMIRRADGELVLDGEQHGLMENDSGVPDNPSGVPAHSFLEHIDVPSDYTGSAGLPLQVGATEDWLEFGAYPVTSVNGQTGDASLGIDDLDDVTLTALADGDVVIWDATATAWVNIPAPPGPPGAGGADGISVGTALQYTTTTTVSATTPSGKWATNNNDFDSTVSLGVSYFDADGNDISGIWAIFTGILNDQIGFMWIQQEDDATVWAAFRLRGVQFYPVGSYALFNADFVGGNADSMPNNTPCRLIFTIFGDQGWSAYEVAVDQGFVGSEGDWLASLVGAQGDPGDAADIAAETSAAATDDSIDDADLFGRVTAGVWVKTAWSNIKVVLKTYFDTLYNLYVHPNHTGDVTSTGDGATVIEADKVLTAMIADAQVTLAKQADLAADTVIGRANGAGTGVPQALTATQVRTIINVASGADVTGTAITALTTKTTPVDADAVVITDSAASDVPKRTTWANIKATLISAFVSNGTWTPVVTGSTTNPTITYTNQFGRYTALFDLLVFYSLRVDVATISGGNGDLRVSIPFTCSNVNSADLVRGAANFNGVDVGVGAYGLHFRPTNGQAYGSWQYSVDNATSVLTAIADVAAGDALIASGWYWK